MRIAFLTPEYITSTRVDGGLANYLKKTAAELSRRGCEVCVFVMSDRDASWQDGAVKIQEVKCLSFFPRLLKNVPVIRNSIPLLGQLSAARSIAKKFWELNRNTNFDLIQVSSYLATGFFLLNNGKVPMICRVSSYSPVVRAAYGKRRSFCDSISDWLEVRQVAEANESFAPSAFVARTLQNCEACHVRVIRTPVEVQDIEHDLSYFNTKRPLGRNLLFFGTLSRIKGVDLLAEVLPSVFLRHPDISCVFIGRDDGLPTGRRIFDYILDHCNDFKEKLYYYPAMQKSKLHPFIANAEAVLMPSRVDNYPNACIEAQMYGIPVIGTFDSSLDEMIIDGETGFLANKNDPESLGGAICRCLDMDEADKKAMRQRILEHVEAMKSEDRIGQLLDLFKQTIEKFDRDL